MIIINKSIDNLKTSYKFLQFKNKETWLEKLSVNKKKMSHFLSRLALLDLHGLQFFRSVFQIFLQLLIIHSVNLVSLSWKK